MKHFYKRGGIVLYNCDCRDLLPRLAGPCAIVTDPPWPNGSARIAGNGRASSLLAEAAVHFPRLASRVVVQLGCDSDPRILAAIPPELPYLRTCWLEYSVPAYKGRILYSGDVAHVFGRPPAPRERGFLLPGKCLSGRVDQLNIKRAPDQPRGKRLRCARAAKLPHPCPRRLEHVSWLVHWFSEPGETVLDPFCGLGTTLLAARQLGRTCIGIEVREEFCEAAAKRLEGSD